MEYFLTIANEKSFSKAAEALHLTQPTLSRQIKELENELEKQLFIRGSRKVSLTEDGILLQKRAEEIVSLVHKTEKELCAGSDEVSGDIFIGAGETDGFRWLLRIANEIKKEHPHIHYHISSGDVIDVLYSLDKGMIDFALIFGSVDQNRYNSITLPPKDTWGVLMRKDSELAGKKIILPKDLYDKPLIISRQTYKKKEITDLFGNHYSNLNIIATHNLIYNASLMVDEGFGYAITFDKLINTENTNLKFIPFQPAVTADMHFIWKKNKAFSKQARLFLDRLKQEMNNNTNASIC